jgi:hypothetical protein
LLGGILKRANEGRRADASVFKRVEHLRPQLEAYESFCDEIWPGPGGEAPEAYAW